MAELKKNLLRECPFCGGEAKIASRSLIDGIHSIESITCKHCHVTIDRIWCQNTPYQTEVNVLEAWNNRATEAGIRAKAIDEFAEKLKRNFRDIGAFTGYEVKREIDEIAEQLKEESTDGKNNGC